MKLDEVYECVRIIREASEDPEVAHSLEDDLHQDVLSAIASGLVEDPAELASAALETRGVEFPRWCA